MVKLPLDRLKPTEFEKFCYELLDSMGFVNLDWRKGSNLSASPADQGRDITGQIIKTDIDGSKSIETWFVECKHHKKSVPPTQLQNLLSWAEAEKPHTVLFIISGYLSNPAKEYLEKYRRNRKPSFNIKLWERPSIEKLCRNKRALLKKHDLLDVSLRKIEEVLSAEQEYFDKVWYDRHQLLKHRIAEGKDTVDKGIWKEAREAAKKIEAKYPKSELGPQSDFDWGMINGKLSALRWIMGDEWDFLDT
jgi:hypothetical protein